MNEQEMLERMGNDTTEEMIHEDFDDKSVDEILTQLNEWWPADENEELAEAVNEFCE